MSKKPRLRYGIDERIRVAGLFERGNGYKAVAGQLGIPRSTVRKWLDVYNAFGVEGLLGMGSGYKHYDWDLKLAAVLAVEEGLSKNAVMAKYGIVSQSSLDRWCRAYREGGAEALRPKPRGRRKGTTSPPKEMTREQELERRVRKLEAENAYLKKVAALKAQRSRTATKPRS